MTHTERFKNTYKILTEETKKRTEKHFEKFYYRSPSMRIFISEAKQYGHSDATDQFPDPKPLSDDQEASLRYALCRSIIYIRNRRTLDDADKFDIITILIKDWRYGYSKRNEERLLKESRKNTIRKVAKTFRYPTGGA